MPATVDVAVGENGELKLVNVENVGDEEPDSHTAKVYRKVADSIRPRSIHDDKRFP